MLRFFVPVERNNFVIEYEEHDRELQTRLLYGDTFANQGGFRDADPKKIRAHFDEIATELSKVMAKDVVTKLNVRIFYRGLEKYNADQQMTASNCKEIIKTMGEECIEMVKKEHRSENCNIM